MSDVLLLIEDEEFLGRELARHFHGSGWEVVHATDLRAARSWLLERGLDPLVVLSDMSLPDGNALDLLEEARKRAVSGEWLFLTGFGTVPDSVRALRLGAFEFLEKPCDIDRLDLLVAGAARSARAHLRLRDQADQQFERYRVDAWAGHSAVAANVRRLLRKLAGVPITGLVITGETGTGKGLAARILHHSGSRSRGPMVEVNCSTLPRELLESELFGHEAGAFTGATRRFRGLAARADQGTLFLDEISEMHLDLQSKLLKLIDDRVVRPLGSEREIRVDIQVIAASNQDLERYVAEGRFREDLFHRLSVFHLHLPALRDRKEDLADLVPTTVAELCAGAGKQIRFIPEEVWTQLEAYDWPGNVRELRNVLERCVLLSEGETLSSDWLQLGDGTRTGVSDPPEREDAGTIRFPLDGSVSLDEMERLILEAVLERTGHNISAAARLLGVTRQTLRYRVDKHHL